MKRFFKREDGYVLVLTLLFMPVLLGTALLVIDISRGNNAQTDLQAAADAVALAGALELDGGLDAITRAKAAMAPPDGSGGNLLANTVGLLAASGDDVRIELGYEDVNGNEFTVIFLEDIPASDDSPIDQAWIEDNATTDGRLANYVHVFVRSRDLTSIFFNPTNFLSQTVPVAARATATRTSGACNVTPLYICNPFEGDGTTDLQTAFSDGKFHGRLFRLHPRGNETERPGNFGFLQVNGSSSADAIRDIFAGEPNPTCYNAGQVETKPGAATSIRQGIGVRFDIWEASYSNAQNKYSPAINVRKGYVGSSNGQTGACNIELAEDPVAAGGFSMNETEILPNQGALGATIGSGDWDIDTYFTVNHGAPPTAAQLAEMNSMPGALSPGASVPSRYDVYRWEIEQSLSQDPGAIDYVANVSSVTGESGLPSCSASKNNAVTPSDEPDRRVIFAAVIDCLANAGNGQTTLNVNSYASIFLARPMEKNGTVDSTIDAEIVDITGWGGNGTLDQFVRNEAVLVR